MKIVILALMFALAAAATPLLVPSPAMADGCQNCN